MTFRRRIMLFGLFVCVFLILGAALMEAGLVQVRDQFLGLMNHDITAKVQTTTIGREVNYVSRLTRNIMLGSDMDKDMKALDETIGKIETAFTALGKTVRTDEDRREFQAAQEATMAFVRACHGRMEQLRALPAAQRAQAYKEYEEAVTPLAMKSRETFATIIKEADKGYDEGLAVFQRTLEQKILLIVVMAGVGAVVAAVCFYLLLRLITRPIQVLTGTLGEIHASWDLTRRLDDRSRDEMGDVAREVNGFLDALEQTIQSVRLNAARVASGSTEMSATATELARAAGEIAEFSENQRQTTERTAAAMHQFSASIQEVAKNAEESQSRSETMVGAASSGVQQGQATVQAMDEVRQSTELMVRAVGVIQELTRQTNLLALNAAIEAAKAGQQGKGFAVVAEEVRKLAERSAVAAREIGSLIQRTTGAIDQGVHTVSATDTTIRMIQENIQAVAVAARDISTATHEQARTSNDVSRQIASVSAATERSAAASTELAHTVDEVNRTAEELASVAEALASSIGRFRTH